MTQINPTNNSHVEWKEFKIEDIFNISPGKRLTKSDMKSGDLPFIGATDSNNGITNFVSNTNTSLDSNVLGVNYNGSVVENFYHPYECIFSDDVKRLSFKDREGNKYLYLFFKTIILQQKEKYRYGYKFNEDRMKRQSILVPVDTNGEPNWEFIENFMKAIEKEVLPDISFSPHIINDNRELDDVEWKSFPLESIFKTLIQGKSKGLVHLKGGDVPYVGATNRNNGVLAFVEMNPKLISKGNTIVFIRNGEGSMGYSFYKAEDFIATSDVTMGYNENINKYTGTFITTVADTVRGKYNFGYKRSNERLKNERLMLPILSNGKPDWEFMEQYMKRMENELMGMVKIKKD